MNLTIAWIGTRQKPEAAGEMILDYVDRLKSYVSIDLAMHRSESALLGALEAERRRTAPVLVLLDSRGKMLSSEEFAGWIGRQQEIGTQMMVLAVGPADGWSEAARSRADLLLSFGRITLPHGLARVVLAEQIYRAFTILAGHPYHGGH